MPQARPSSPSRGSALHRVWPVLLVALCALLPRATHAYPWVIRHGYSGCVQCHQDPSGAGVLTEYGRAQAQILMTGPWGGGSDPGEGMGFLFGALNLPSAVAVQYDARSMVWAPEGKLAYRLMVNDLRTQVKLGRVRLHGELGAPSLGATGAWITSNPDGFNLISREYWVGLDLGTSVLVRAGRLPIPYGIRTEEHLLYVRAVTRTTTNDDQQVGLSAAWYRGPFRAEAMGIAGNYQLAPDDFRERGGAGYVSWAPTNQAEVGLSGLWTHALLDAELGVERTRQAAALHGRLAPLGRLAVLAEGDLTRDVLGAGTTRLGWAAVLQADLEPVQGIHVRATGEGCDDRGGDDAAPVGTGTLGAHWFFWSRADLRVDGGYGVVTCTPGADPYPLALASFHLMI